MITGDAVHHAVYALCLPEDHNLDYQARLLVSVNKWLLGLSFTRQLHVQRKVLFFIFLSFIIFLILGLRCSQLCNSGSPFKHTESESHNHCMCCFLNAAEQAASMGRAYWASTQGAAAAAAAAAGVAGTEYA